MPNTLERTTDTSQPSVVPQAPALDSFATLPSGFNPNFGNSSSDLLSDQVNLTYQIFNLQMLLERALSDRLQSGDTTECRDPAMKTGCNATRLQAILGFNVSIDPPRTANDAVAVVEIKLTSPNGASLVGLMPQEKTYNSAALSSKSNAFGAAAAVNVFQVGFSARKRGQVFYLYRDTDTLSYQRMDADGSVVFGWMFRPVLGRRSVSPGLKQMFSIVSLPNIDCKLADATPCSVPVKTTVRSYWKKFDHGTETSFRDDEANRSTRALYGVTFGLTHPEILDHGGHENQMDYSDLTVHSTHDYQRDLSPVVDAVEWYATGAKSVVVSATGNNFFTNTQVNIGDKVFASPADGLILKSNQAFDLITNLDQLVDASGSVIGRYGSAVPLIRTGLPSGSLSTRGIRISGVQLQSSLASNHRLQITLSQQQSTATLQDRTSKYKAWQDLMQQRAASSSVEVAQQAYQKAGDEAAQEAKLTSLLLPVVNLVGGRTIPQSPIVSVNGKALTMPYDIVDDPQTGRVNITANVPDSLVPDHGGTVKVTWPFYNPNLWTATENFFDPSSAFEVTRISQKSVVIRRIGGLAFVNDPARNIFSPEDESDPSDKSKDHCWKLLAGDKALPLETNTCKSPAAKAPASKKTGEVKLSQPSEPKADTLVLHADYVAAATSDSLPSEAVLLAPNGSTYHLVIPDVKKKDDAAPVLSLKQFDSAWISIPIGIDKVPAHVEANGKSLSWRPDDAPKIPDAKPAAKSISVEVTRDLTSKPGSVDISISDAAGKLIVKKSISISCTECKQRAEK